jgi:hypothetical protein
MAQKYSLALHQRPSLVAYLLVESTVCYKACEDAVNAMLRWNWQFPQNKCLKSNTHSSGQTATCVGIGWQQATEKFTPVALKFSLDKISFNIFCSPTLTVGKRPVNSKTVLICSIQLWKKVLLDDQRQTSKSAGQLVFLSPANDMTEKTTSSSTRPNFGHRFQLV